MHYGRREGTHPTTVHEHTPHEAHHHFKFVTVHEEPTHLTWVHDAHTPAHHRFKIETVHEEHTHPMRHTTVSN